MEPSPARFGGPLHIGFLLVGSRTESDRREKWGGRGAGQIDYRGRDDLKPLKQSLPDGAARVSGVGEGNFAICEFSGSAFSEFFACKFHENCNAQFGVAMSVAA